MSTILNPRVYLQGLIEETINDKEIKDFIKITFLKSNIFFNDIQRNKKIVGFIILTIPKSISSLFEQFFNKQLFIIKEEINQTRLIANFNIVKTYKEYVNITTDVFNIVVDVINKTKAYIIEIKHDKETIFKHRCFINLFSLFYDDFNILFYQYSIDNYKEITENEEYEELETNDILIKYKLNYEETIVPEEYYNNEILRLKNEVEIILKTIE